MDLDREQTLIIADTGEPGKKNLTAFIKRDDVEPSCPDEIHCALELIEMDDEDYPSLVIEDMESPNQKKLTASIKKIGVNCDYVLNASMVLALPPEFLYITGGTGDVTCYTIFDLAAGRVLDLETFEPRDGSPEVTFTLPGVIDRDNDPVPYPFVAWLTYNFVDQETDVTTAYTSHTYESPCANSLQWPEPWTRTYTTWWDDLNGNGIKDDDDNYGGTITHVCNYNQEQKLTEISYYYAGSPSHTNVVNTSDFPSKTGYELVDNAGGAVTIDFNEKGTHSYDQHHSWNEVVTSKVSAVVGDSGAIDIFYGAESWYQSRTSNDASGKRSIGGGGGFAGLGALWDYQMVVGFEYICLLGGAQLSGVLQNADLSPTGWDLNANGYPFPPTTVEETLEDFHSVVPVPAVALLEDITIDEETGLISVTECINKSLSARNGALAAAIKDMYDKLLEEFPDLSDADRNFALNYGPGLVMKGKRFDEE